jgi:ribonuclease T2
VEAGATLTAMAAFVLPGIANAQALVCTPPGSPPRPNPELLTADQPQRVLPIAGYTLAITPAPQFCSSGGFTPSAG